MTLEVNRWAMALGLCLAYGLLCAWVAWRHRRQQQVALAARAALLPAQADAIVWTVAYASQTGQAEDLAMQTAQSLHAAGVPVRLCALDELDAQALATCTRLLVIASTYGEGDPPDAAAQFAQTLMSQSAQLSHLHHAVLALGDSSYEQFCGFGRALDAWLRASGSQPIFDRIDVDQMNVYALAAWHQRLAHVAGTSDAPDWSGPAFTPWQLMAREVLNPGSQGEAVFHLELLPADGVLPSWQAGDLAQVLPPDGQGRARDYSVAAIPEDGRVHLLMRLHRLGNGEPGLVSGYLGLDLAVGGMLSVRLRPHRAFQLGENHHRPLILIGNGTGMAGLRAHLKARAVSRMTDASVPSCWLIFGERQSTCDFHHHADVVHWQQSGVLERVDAVFSRDQAERRYVQHRLQEVAAPLREWVHERGAAIYVCGSLQGMASEVDAVLRQVLGDQDLDALSRAGRYRRDVY